MPPKKVVRKIFFFKNKINIYSFKVGSKTGPKAGSKAGPKAGPKAGAGPKALPKFTPVSLKTWKLDAQAALGVEVWNDAVVLKLLGSASNTTKKALRIHIKSLIDSLLADDTVLPADGVLGLFGDVLWLVKGVDKFWVHQASSAEGARMLATNDAPRSGCGGDYPTIGDLNHISIALTCVEETPLDFGQLDEWNLKEVSELLKAYVKPEKHQVFHHIPKAMTSAQLRALRPKLFPLIAREGVMDEAATKILDLDVTEDKIEFVRAAVAFMHAKDEYAEISQVPLLAALAVDGDDYKLLEQAVEDPAFEVAFEMVLRHKRGSAQLLRLPWTETQQVRDLLAKHVEVRDFLKFAVGSKKKLWKKKTNKKNFFF